MPGIGISTGAMGLNPGLPDGREAPEAGARGDAGLLAERAELAPGAAADGQPAQQWRSDDAVQHLTVRLRSRVNNLLWKTIISSLFIRKGFGQL